MNRIRHYEPRGTTPAEELPTYHGYYCECDLCRDCLPPEYHRNEYDRGYDAGLTNGLVLGACGVWLVLFVVQLLRSL